MKLPHDDAFHWVIKARKAARTAEVLTEADAKAAMLDLSLFYLGEAVARTVAPDDCPVDRLQLAQYSSFTA